MYTMASLEFFFKNTATMFKCYLDLGRFLDALQVKLLPYTHSNNQCDEY